MVNIITAGELALWTQGDQAEVAADPWAAEVIRKVSQMAQFLAGRGQTTPVEIPLWTVQTAPYDVRMTAILIAKRTYQNPDQIIQEGIGPINQRVADAAAMLMELTDAERHTFTKYNADGDPDLLDSGLWVQATTREAASTLRDNAILYVPDDSMSDWYIPMYSPDDPGDPNLYPEDS